MAPNVRECLVRAYRREDGTGRQVPGVMIVAIGFGVLDEDAGLK